jgi:hypothetical protein
MSVRLAAAVVTLTHWWVQAYTNYAPPDLARARRSEVESDVWEMQNDAELAGSFQFARMAIWRLMTGVPDDLAWCFDVLAFEEQLLIRRLVALTVASVMVLSLWALPSFFVNGRKEVAKCAATTPQIQTDADLRFELMRCAGAFFFAAR